MEIKTIASGSSGNCYRITANNNSPLLLECGIPIKEIVKALKFSLSSTLGCLITHEHKDHAKAILEVMDWGVDCYCSKGTAEALGIFDKGISVGRLHIIKALQKFDIGDWTVLPFEALHDAAEPLSFLIFNRVTREKLLFATDTYYIPYRFRGLTHIMIECNYAMDVLNEMIDRGVVDSKRKNRILKSHMNLENCMRFLRSNDLSNVDEIILIHLSKNNGDGERFKREVIAATGCPVSLA